MKQVIFSALLIITCYPTKAQISNSKIYKDTVVMYSSPHAIAINPPKYKFLFDNGYGKVFESQIDKMRCLSFYGISRMPVAGKMSDPDSNKLKEFPMPNPMIPNLIIPAPLNKVRPNIKK